MARKALAVGFRFRSAGLQPGILQLGLFLRVNFAERDLAGSPVRFVL